jgi:hypothetical protein
VHLPQRLEIDRAFRNHCRHVRLDDGVRELALEAVRQSVHDRKRRSVAAHIALTPDES